MQMVRMLNLERQYAALRPAIDAAIARVLGKRPFVLGEQVASLEDEIARYCRTDHAVGVASGTDALLLSLKAAGVGPGSEVILPAFTSTAEAQTVSLLGATPVFADIAPQTYTIDPAQMETLITPATRAIIAVHLYGQAADIFALLRVARQHGLALLGDTAQALGATYAGEPACGYGDYGCLSFFPSRNLGAYGDGGMIVTGSTDAANYLKAVRVNGGAKRSRGDDLEWNSRLDEIQAAILRVKLPHLDDWNRARQEHAARYDHALSQIEEVVLPKVAPKRSHVFHEYTIRVPQRDKVQALLKERGVESAVHYPVPLHLQPIYRSLGYKKHSLPEAEKAAHEVLSLPMYPDLEEAEIMRVVGAVGYALVRTRSRSRVQVSAQPDARTAGNLPV